MLFRQLLNEDLGCASYLVASGGDAAVVDPGWEIDPYLELATEHSLAIRHILETHSHADHVSGRGRLALATGAKIHVPERAGVEFEHEPIADGDRLRLGDVVEIVARSAAGHRPEHTAYLVIDHERDDGPWALLSGDSLFVGDVARPDLAVEPREGAQGLHRTLRSFGELEGRVELWPGHIGGSMCGGSAMSEKPSSTLALERRANPYLAIESEHEFVERLTGELGEQPPNFERIVELNRGPLITEPVALSPLSAERVGSLVEDGAVLVDVREPREHDGVHVPGSISVPAIGTGVGTRAAWVLDPEREAVLVAPSDADAIAAASLLEAVGLRSLRGYLHGGIAAWRTAGLELEATAAIAADQELVERLAAGGVGLLDVRDAEEWDSAHVRDSIHVPFHALRDGVPSEVREAKRPLAVACASGIRSAIACSLLRRAGIDGLEHVALGGVEELIEAGAPAAAG